MEETIEQPYGFSDDILPQAKYQQEDFHQVVLKTGISQVSQQNKIHEEQRFGSYF